MAWALKFDGVDDFAAFAKVSKVGDFKIEALGVEFLSTPTGSDFETIMGSDNFTDFLAYRASSNGWYWRNNNVNTVFPNTTVPLPVGQFDLTLERIGSTATLTVNGSSDSASSNGANPFRVAAIGMINSSSPSAAHGGNIRIQQLKFYDTTLSLHLDADSSSHDPGTPVLSDIVGTNHATGSNMPTDGSAWEELGGGPATVIPVIMNSYKQRRL